MVLKANEKRVQVVRHRVGQLDSVKRLPYEELEAMRTETAARLKALEAKYWGQEENKTVGKKIRDAYKQHGFAMDTVRNADEILEHELAAERQKSKKKSRSKSKKKDLDSTVGGPDSLAKPKDSQFEGGKQRSMKVSKTTGNLADAEDAGRSRSRSRKATSKGKSVLSPEEVGLQYANPHHQIYEAKFEKYLANKKAKQEKDRRKAAARAADFDIYTKGPGSPSKLSKRFKPHHDPVGPTTSGKYDADELMPADYDQKKLAEEEGRRRQRGTTGDPFEDLGVSAADKMSFFLLKWVFNAIKRESSSEDPAFKGQPYISKSDLIK